MSLPVMKVLPSARARVARAFRTLATHNILARTNFLCCQSCGVAGMRARAKGSRWTGYAFYHAQDADAFDATGRLQQEMYIAFGVFAGRDPKEVGVHVANALRTAGLTVSWTGRTDQRICITGVA